MFILAKQTKRRILRQPARWPPWKRAQLLTKVPRALSLFTAVLLYAVLTSILQTDERFVVEGDLADELAYGRDVEEVRATPTYFPFLPVSSPLVFCIVRSSSSSLTLSPLPYVPAAGQRVPSLATALLFLRCPEVGREFGSAVSSRYFTQSLSTFQFEICHCSFRGACLFTSAKILSACRILTCLLCAFKHPFPWQCIKRC